PPGAGQRPSRMRPGLDQPGPYGIRVSPRRHPRSFSARAVLRGQSLASQVDGRQSAGENPRALDRSGGSATLRCCRGCAAAGRMIQPRSRRMRLTEISPGELVALPVIVTLFLWVTTPNPVELFALACAFCMLLIPWGSYLC